MRVSLLVIFSLVGMAMSQGVSFRESMLGHMISDTVAGGRNTVGNVMDIFSTIGNGMSKMIGVPVGLRRKNNRLRNQPQFRENDIRDGGLRPLQESDLNYDYQDDFVESSPRSQRQQIVNSGPRPQRRRRPTVRSTVRPQRLRKQQQFDPLQRMSNNAILALANPQPNTKSANPQPNNKRQPHFSLQ